LAHVRMAGMNAAVDNRDLHRQKTMLALWRKLVRLL
jgi:hypothetical protein